MGVHEESFLDHKECVIFAQESKERKFQQNYEFYFVANGLG